MSSTNNIFVGDLSQMMESQVTLSERVSTDPKVLDEVAFRDAHGGMSRATWAARVAHWRTDNEQVGTLSGLQGEPPEFDLRAKLSPQRARYARYSRWVLRERKNLEGLEAKKAEFEAMIAAPAATQAEIRGLIRQAADRLLGRGKVQVSAGARKQFDDTLAEQKLAAEAASEALPELERQIETARQRVNHLIQREDEFLKPAMIEIAEDLGLGQVYMDRLRQFREVFDLIAGLAAVAGEYGGALGNGQIECMMRIDGDLHRGTPDAVKFPVPNFKSLNADEDSTIQAGGRQDVWKALRQSLILDPAHKAYIPLPK